MGGFPAPSNGSIPYLLLAPGLLWLALFYVIPAVQMFLVSLWTGNARVTATSSPVTRHLPRGAHEYFAPQFIRSFVYGGARDDPDLPARLPARVLHRVPRRPLQEPPAVPGRRAVLHELPAADALVEDHPCRRRARARAAQGRSASCPRSSGCWRRPIAVIAGITYNFLPFMTLPLYVALEKIDRRLLEAAEDLYAGSWRRVPAGDLAAGAARHRSPGRS